MSSGRGIYAGGELTVDLSGDVALKHALDLPCGLALGEPALLVGTGVGVTRESDAGDSLKRGVQASVSVPVQTMPGGVAAGCRDGSGGGEGGERCFVPDSAWMGVRGQEHRGRDRADAANLEETRRELCDVLAERVEVAGKSIGEFQDIPREPDCFGARSGPVDALTTASSPSRDSSHLRVGQRPPRVDAEVDDSPPLGSRRHDQLPSNRPAPEPTEPTTNPLRAGIDGPSTVKMLQNRGLRLAQTFKTPTFRDPRPTQFVIAHTWDKMDMQMEDILPAARLVRLEKSQALRIKRLP
jgi:hypothetical protein